MIEPIRIALTGGATGGHLFPLVAVGKALRAQVQAKNRQPDLLYIGAPPFRAEALKEEGIACYPIGSTKLRKYFDWHNLTDILKFPLGFLKALFLLYHFMPDVVFSKGGPGSLQVVLAAWVLQIPILIHESDSIPGRTNLLSRRFATRVAVSFEKAKKYFPIGKTALLGNPVDPDLSQLQPSEETYTVLALDPSRPIILVLGGSQGSEKINEVIVRALPEFLQVAQVIHQMGSANFQERRLEAAGFILQQVPIKKNDYHPFSFVSHSDLMLMLKMATLIISRAGGGAIFEIAASSVPSILIPLPERTGGRHQIENAYEYADTGAAAVIEEPNLTPHILASLVRKVLNEPETQKAMSTAARAFSKPDAADLTAKEILYLINEE